MARHSRSQGAPAGAQLLCSGSSQAMEFSLVSMESHGWIKRRGPRHRPLWRLVWIRGSAGDAFVHDVGAFMLGNSIQSTSPATGLSNFLMATASGLRQTSRAKGPSAMHPGICLRSAILDKMAASTQAGIPGSICSVAATKASLGLGIPSA
jgi:hypothetical protein